MGCGDAGAFISSLVLILTGKSTFCKQMCFIAGHGHNNEVDVKSAVIETCLTGIQNILIHIPMLVEQGLLEEDLVSHNSNLVNCPASRTALSRN